MRQFIKETITRVYAQTPAYFKKIQAGAISLAGTGTGLIAAQSIPHVHIPAILVTISGYMITAGAIAAATAQAAKSDKTVEQSDITQNKN